MVASPFGKDPLAKALTMLSASADKLAYCSSAYAGALSANLMRRSHAKEHHDEVADAVCDFSRDAAAHDGFPSRADAEEAPATLVGQNSRPTPLDAARRCARTP